MKAAYAKKWLLGVAWLLAGALAGYLLLVLVYCLPVQRMQKHLESCVDAFADGAAALVKDDTGTWVDYLTDSLILAQAVYRGEESPWEQAAASYSNAINAEGEQPWAYRKIQAALEEQQVGAPYARYWHGNLVYLKPLLFVLDYKDILALNMLAQLGLALWIAQLLARRGLAHLLPAAALAFGMLTPTAMAMCIQYMPCFYVMAAACILLLKKPDFVQRHAGLFFLTVGMATCYFDYLTFPLITLGVPLALWLLLAPSPWRQGVARVVQSSLCWGVGYVVFLGGKMGVGVAGPGREPFCRRREQPDDPFFARDRRAGDRYLDVLRNNFQAYGLRTWKLLFALLALALLAAAFTALRSRARGPARDRAIPLCMVACMPFAWYLVAMNHSYIHFGYTHKELMITGWALACLAAELWRVGRQPAADGGAPCAAKGK